MRRKRIKVRFEECASLVPVFKFDVKGRSVCALVDTGAETTLFNKELIKNINIDYTVVGDSTTFVGMSGEGNKIPIVVSELECKMEQDEFKLDGMLANLNPVAEHFAKIYGDKFYPDVLLGSDNLNKLDAKIDFDKKEMTLLCTP